MHHHISVTHHTHMNTTFLLHVYIFSMCVPQSPFMSQYNQFLFNRVPLYYTKLDLLVSVIIFCSHWLTLSFSNTKNQATNMHISLMLLCASMLHATQPNKISTCWRLLSKCLVGLTTCVHKPIHTYLVILWLDFPHTPLHRMIVLSYIWS